MKGNKKKKTAEAHFGDSIESISHPKSSAYKIIMYLKIESSVFVKYWMMNLTWQKRSKWIHTDMFDILLTPSETEFTTVEWRRAERQIAAYYSIWTQRSFSNDDLK